MTRVSTFNKEFPLAFSYPWLWFQTTRPIHPQQNNWLSWHLHRKFVQPPLVCPLHHISKSSNSGGERRWGVLSNTSPFLKVMTWLTACKSSGILNNIKFVLSSCTTFPLTCNCNRTLWGSGILSFLINLLTGKNVSYPVHQQREKHKQWNVPFAAVHGSPAFLASSWTFLAVISIPTPLSAFFARPRQNSVAVEHTNCIPLNCTLPCILAFWIGNPVRSFRVRCTPWMSHDDRQFHLVMNVDARGNQHG